MNRNEGAKLVMCHIKDSCKNTKKRNKTKNLTSVTNATKGKIIIPDFMVIEISISRVSVDYRYFYLYSPHRKILVLYFCLDGVVRYHNFLFNVNQSGRQLKNTIVQFKHQESCM